MKAFFRGFVYAAQGIKVAVLEERNLRFHLCAAFYVYLFSLFYNFGKTEYALLTILVAGVLSFELVNTALERAVSQPPDERYAIAGVVKDVAAGAVLVFSAGAAVCGIILFWDIAVFRQIVSFFLAKPLLLVLFIVSLVVSYWFIFIFRMPFKRKDSE